jgi:hypothetical protein
MHLHILEMAYKKLVDLSNTYNGYITLFNSCLLGSDSSSSTIIKSIIDRKGSLLTNIEKLLCFFDGTRPTIVVVRAEIIKILIDYRLQKYTGENFG